ncbi:50S ribosomal protein L29 [Patescibacteria group bacterium]|nr:50S ribosomal protein L29 [Patescibacteria group bacterium]MBU1867878.1 50S ribosomal protein L29 [Patescibacteria group bacterium]
MKKQQFLKDILNKDLTQLEQQLQEIRAELNEIRIQLQMNKLKDYSKIKTLKRNIAQILTIINHLRRGELYGS